MRSYHLYVDGSSCESADGATREAWSPGDGQVFATVAWGGPLDAVRAVQAAARAAPAWASTPAVERAALCQRVVAGIEADRDDLARALSQDQGKPLRAEAADEVDELMAYFRMAAEDAVRVEGRIPPSVRADRRAFVYRVPLGVVGVVTPWNWPYTMGAELFAPALAAGNSVVWVPAPTTSACSARLAEVIAAAGLPPGVFNFVTGDGPIVGDAVVSHPLVNGVGFIGSVATGNRIAERAAGKVQVLELGGNGPFVVLSDADLDLVIPAILESAFLCAGQSCTAGERFLVHRSRRAELVEALAVAVAGVRLGDPFDPATIMGPMNNEPTAAKVDAQVADALAQGARLVAGGRRSPQRPTRLYYEPTVIDAVTPDMAIAAEETFGPIVPIVEVSSDAEALELTNRAPYGLLAAVFTADLERGLRFAEAARSGWVNINLSTNTWESHLPFGGRAGTASGSGRVGGAAVMDAFTEPKTVLMRLAPAGRPTDRPRSR
jgi:acyl-CoA reductase-like NAD-dependent aldehyde dehydrogenase